MSVFQDGSLCYDYNIKTLGTMDWIYEIEVKLRQIKRDIIHLT